MGKVLSFIGLDARLMRPYLKSALFVVAFGVVFGAFMKSGGMTLSLSFVTVILFVQYPFAVEEKSNLHVLYGTLTLSRRAVVIGRYLFSALFALAGITVSFVSAAMIDLIFTTTVDFGGGLAVACVLFGVFLIVASIQFPVYFKLGYTKGRMLAYIPLFAVFIVITLLPMLSKLFSDGVTVEEIFANLSNDMPLVCTVSLIIGLAAACLSAFISYRIYQKKDM